MSSYAELQEQIRQLQQQAEALLQAEKAQVIANLRAEIARFGLTARDLGLTAAAPASVTRTRTMRTPRFRGPRGELWSGMGRQPNWFKQALAEGLSEQDLRID